MFHRINRIFLLFLFPYIHSTMKLSCYFLLVTGICILASCSLNADQETALNQHVSRYLKAKNGCMVVGLVGFTHPDYIRELKQQGDSVLLKKMDCSESYQQGIKYTDPTLRRTQTSDDTIHVYYELDVEKGTDGTKQRRAEGVYAISEDDGKTWFFLSKEVYQDKQVCPSFHRLLPPQ